MRKGILKGKSGAKAMAFAIAMMLGITNLGGITPAAVAYAETNDSGEGNSSVDNQEDKSDSTSKDETTKTEENKDLPSKTETEKKSEENKSDDEKDAVSEDEKKSEETADGEKKDNSGNDEEKSKEEDGSEKEKEAVEGETEDKKEKDDSEKSDADTKNESSSDRNFDDNKTDVWDFGAEDFGSSYNNRLDVYTINSIYPEGTKEGATGVEFATFSIDDGDFYYSSNKTNNRIISINTALTRKQDGSYKDKDGNVYTGAVYSNSGSNPNQFLALKCKAGDVITFYVSSNGGDSTYVFENVNDSSDYTEYDYKCESKAVKKAVFYPSSDGTYKLYSRNEKLVVCRVTREHAKYHSVSGVVEGYKGNSSFDIVFTNKNNGSTVTAAVTDGAFTAELAEGVTYEMSLDGAKEYVITSEKEVNISSDTELLVTVEAVNLVSISGTVKGIDEDDAQSFVDNSVFEFKASDEAIVYEPEIELSYNGKEIAFTVSVEKDVLYEVSVEGVDDYELKTNKVSYSKDLSKEVLEFEKKGTTKIEVEVKCDGKSLADFAESTFTFVMIDPDNEYKDTNYSYSFTGKDIADGKASLREGQYRVMVKELPEGVSFDEERSRDAIVDEKHIENGVHKVIVPFVIKNNEKVSYKSTVTVGKGRDYETISEAMDAIRRMDRSDDQRVVVSIDPGDYQEMVVVDVPNVTFKNSKAGGSIVPTNSGVFIEDSSVRITSYYGHGYTYYSMGSDCKYDKEILEVNNYNGYTSFSNPGGSTTSGSYWNATVVVSASGFEAYDVIFENSFNQYQSELAAKDTIVKMSGAKENANGTTRSQMTAGDTAVQDKAYVERAAAIAFTNDVKNVYMNHCAFIGRQDTFYGGQGASLALYDCDIYGGTDYIFGAMTAVFAKCDLVLNTSDAEKDYGFITAAQQKSSSTRGYLMYNCTVTSTKPGVNTASAGVSKPGFFGRPWQKDTSEVVFFDTIIEASGNASLINPAGWNDSLSGTTLRNVEYGTYETAKVDNSGSRVSWAPVSDKPYTTDGKEICVATFLGSWDPFAEHGDDMTIKFPDGTSQDQPSSSEEPTETTEFVFAASELDVIGASENNVGKTISAGTENFFTIIMSKGTKVDNNSKTFDDGYSSSRRLTLGGKASASANVIKFTTTKAATVKVWWVEQGDDNRQIVLLNEKGESVVATNGQFAKSSTNISELKLEKAGTYLLGATPNSNYIFKVEVSYETKEIEKVDWEQIEKPVIKSVSLNKDDASKIDVVVDAFVGEAGADKLTVTMYDTEANVISSLESSKYQDQATLSFAPKLSGEYYFVAKINRGEELIKTSEKSETVSFALPLTAPVIKNAVNKGNGNVAFKFYSVVEATEYTLYLTDKTDLDVAASKATFKPEKVETNTTTEYVYTFVGLTIGHTYELSITANRGEDKSKESKVELTVTADGEREWTFAAYGSGEGEVKEENAGYKVTDSDVTLWNVGNKGKLLPASTDGLAFYYTAVPSNKNFVFTVTVTIDSWTFSNGQEGFGIMACDRVGVHGDGRAFWNNSYMASGTKVEYYYDSEKGEATKNETGIKVTMKDGLGVQEKVGVTPDNLALLESNDTATINSEFSSNMYPLETSCGAYGTGTYNLFGNEAGQAKGTVNNPITKLTLRIQKNNTGYFVSYLDENGNVIATKKFYDTQALSVLDKDNVYVGMFVSRTFKATFSNISLEVIDSSEDAPAEEKPVTYVEPSYKVVSSEHSNTASYELMFMGNADGALAVTDSKGTALLTGKEVKAGEVVSVKTNLVRGNNRFNIAFTPVEGFHPEGDESKVLSTYETKEFAFVATYLTINDGANVYVAPDGSANGTGTENDPVDIYTAVKYVQPGQTIRVKEGTYNLSKTVIIERGIDGTPSKPIKLISEGGRAIFDFGGKCAGFILAGDYWHISGIDCTKSGNSMKGIQVSGSHITLEDIRAYENGNTGIQVSRYLSSDSREMWPSYDLILNCTSYSNADSGYEDADGFAAKLTVGDGIVFDGCISYNNADDGWDLFAKPETGPIGQVTIKNCVAFANGYGVDGKEEGNGNGFKMGGSSINGAHKLINCVAWGNKAKGIDSNSGPDIMVYNSMSYNNGGSNVALYTNDNANTNFYVQGVISYRTQNKGTNETIKTKGTQETSKIYGTKNFFWNSEKSQNSEGLTVTDDWFVSLDAPYADASNPYAVAKAMRKADGSIDLGDFLKLTDKALQALSGAGINYTDVVATLSGDYKPTTSERDIDGSADDAKKDEDNTSGNTSGGSSSTGAGSSSGSTSSASGNTSESGSGTGNTSGSGNASGNGNNSGNTSGSGNNSGNTSGNSSESTPSGSASATGSTTTSGQSAETTGNTNTSGNTNGNTTGGNNSATGQGGNTQNPDEAVAGASRDDNAQQHSSNEAASSQESASTEASNSEGTNTDSSNEESSTPADETPSGNFPVVPVATAGVTIIIIAGIFTLAKKGLLLKLLLLLKR